MTRPAGGRRTEGGAVQYLLLIYEDQSYWQNLPPEQFSAEMKPWREYADWLRDKGWYVGGQALEPTTSAVTVREREGKTLTTDGPFAETKEQLGGYYLVECDDVEKAVEAASRIPSVVRGSIEVRPIMDFSQVPA
jgi:hypothetical protein